MPKVARGRDGRGGGEPSAAAAAAAAAEAPAGRGLDNLTVPAAAGVVFWALAGGAA
jgi:hypothetical protein